MTSVHVAAARDRPIGIFDSGFGGLTVAAALHDRLPNESLLYFGDTARVPYGAKSPTVVRRFAREAAAFLLSRDIKALVIACNTASAHAEAALREELEIPVVGVIEPGARAAVEATTTGRIGVLGTAGTLRSGAYDLAIRRHLGEPGRVYAQPCPLLVPLVEEGWAGHSATAQVVHHYLAPLEEVDVDVVILGCTHYPLLHDALQAEVGPDVVLVDSGRETARVVARVLRESALERTPEAPPDHAFFVSDSPHRFREIGRRFMGDLLTHVTHVDIDGLGHHMRQLRSSV